MKAIRLAGEKEFGRLRSAIDLMASDAADHFYLLNGLDESRQEYSLEMNESNTFWHLTFTALRETVLSRLCLLYDKDGAALSLSRFLLTVKANLALFSDAAFRERLKGNPHVNTLVEGRAIDVAKLDAELVSVSAADPLVRKLLNLRNKVISHAAADTVMTGIPQPWLPAKDVETLLDRARAITGKYSLLYQASMCGGFAAADDYKATLTWVRKGLSAHRAQIEKEIQTAGAR
jgi:hypothetical protein